MIIHWTNASSTKRRRNKASAEIIQFLARRTTPHPIKPFQNDKGGTKTDPKRTQQINEKADTQISIICCKTRSTNYLYRELTSPPFDSSNFFVITRKIEETPSKTNKGGTKTTPKKTANKWKSRHSDLNQFFETRITNYMYRELTSSPFDSSNCFVLTRKIDEVPSKTNLWENSTVTKTTPTSAKNWLMRFHKGSIGVL